MTSRSHAHDIGAAKTVPFNQIFIDPKVNSRKKLKGIPELAKSIDQNGLQSALTVTNGGDDKHPYTLQAGFRRAAAMNSLGWGNKPVNIIVVEKGPDANLIENIQREGLPALDLAERICKMLDGSYHVPEGSEPRTYTKAEISGILSKSTSHVANFVRVHNEVTDEVKALVKDHEPSARVLFAWAAMSKPKQLEAAEAWVKDQDALVKSGKTRKAKGSKGEGEGSGGGKSSPGKKILMEKYEQLAWKGESVKGKSGEIAQAAAEVLGFVLGVEGHKRFPTDIFSAEDAKAYKEAMKEADAEEEVEEDGEE
jgi:ParB/RepB/Spo0J family partition protein